MHTFSAKSVAVILDFLQLAIEEWTNRIHSLVGGTCKIPYLNISPNKTPQTSKPFPSFCQLKILNSSNVLKNRSYDMIPWTSGKKNWWWTLTSQTMPTISKQDIIQNQNFLPCFKCYCKSQKFSHDNESWHVKIFPFPATFPIFSPRFRQGGGQVCALPSPRTKSSARNPPLRARSSSCRQPRWRWGRWGMGEVPMDDFTMEIAGLTIQKWGISWCHDVSWGWYDLKHGEWSYLIYQQVFKFCIFTLGYKRDITGLIYSVRFFQGKDWTWMRCEDLNPRFRVITPFIKMVPQL